MSHIKYINFKYINSKKNNVFNLYYYDDEWQKPVITEYQTFKLLFCISIRLINYKLRDINMLNNFKINENIFLHNGLK